MGGGGGGAFGGLVVCVVYVRGSGGAWHGSLLKGQAGYPGFCMASTDNYQTSQTS